MYTRSRYRLQEPLGNSVAVLGRRIIVSDEFTRADSAVTLGSAETGQAWTAHVGTAGISSNKAYVPTPNAVSPQLATVPAGNANGIVQAVLSGTGLGGGTAQPWLVFRFVDTSNYLLVSAQSPTTIEIFKCDTGSFTQIGTGAYTWGSSQTVVVSFAGPDIQVAVDGVGRASASNVFSLTATRHGLGGCANLDSTVRYDSFRVAA